jgi:hypothetical protein
MRKLVRHEIYDETGLVKVDEIEIEVPDIEEEINLKEEQLLEMYKELELLKQQRDANI